MARVPTETGQSFGGIGRSLSRFHASNPPSARDATTRRTSNFAVRPGVDDDDAVEALQDRVDAVEFQLADLGHVAGVIVADQGIEMPFALRASPAASDPIRQPGGPSFSSL